jgi:hypothetical protein
MSQALLAFWIATGADLEQTLAILMKNEIENAAKIKSMKIQREEIMQNINKLRATLAENTHSAQRRW